MTMIPKPAHPRPDRKRAAWQNLNGAWDFSFETEAFDRQITVPFSWTSPLSGIQEDRKGTGYYRKKVRYNAGKNRLFLIIGAADYTCTVFVNGQELMTHEGGYAPIEVDVTDAWQNEVENTVVVRVTDNDCEDQTYGKQGYGNIRGIWQTVYLEERPALYIESFTVRTQMDGTVCYTVQTAGQGKLRQITTNFGGVAATSTEKTVTLHLTQPNLWSPEHPYLYEGTLTLESDTGTDTVETYFGVREIGTARFEAEGAKYITLNGAPIYLNGTLDQSFNPQGHFTLPTDAEEENEILRMKAIGLNMARIHIKSEEPLKLYYADKHGLLIMEDIPCYWGEPTELAKTRFETQMAEAVRRDINHPAVFYWIVFNETWGLLSHVRKPEGQEDREYLPETQEWVRHCWKLVKSWDPTRPVEDNSPCRNDHVATDVNTWHFYSNGYQEVRQVVQGASDGHYVGSTWNFVNGNTCPDVPLLNSECGNVWGVKGNAGDSDISWHYKYMMNEFRLHEKIGGFVFTEFHDVVNEFNGYYRIDNDRKLFGYEEYVPGMTLCDLHAPDFLCYDRAPMTTEGAGTQVVVPLSISSFTAQNHGKPMTVRWNLVHTNRAGQQEITAQGAQTVTYARIGTTKLFDLPLQMPETDGVATLQLMLADGEEILMRNFCCFDVFAQSDVLSIEPMYLRAEGFDRAWAVQQGAKWNGLGAGKASVSVNLRQIPNWTEGKGVTLRFEASARFPMTRDNLNRKEDKAVDMNYMRGYRVDAGANPNSFFMTDERAEPGDIAVYADTQKIAAFTLPDSPADSRGCLSWHYQRVHDLLDEAGTYGYLCTVTLSPEVVRTLPERFSLTFETASGVSVFGRRSGRYPVAIDLSAE